VGADISEKYTGHHFYPEDRSNRFLTTNQTTQGYNLEDNVVIQKCHETLKSCMAVFYTIKITGFTISIDLFV
jgi:hypothetical protein